MKKYLLFALAVLFPCVLTAQNLILPDVKNMAQDLKKDLARKAYIYQHTKFELEQYYGREDFSGKEWVRVSNFLNWVKINEAEIESRFPEFNLEASFRSWPHELVGVLGTLYVADKHIPRSRQKAMPKIYMCMHPIADNNSFCLNPNDGFVENLNTAMHETSHLMSAITIDPLKLDEFISSYITMKYSLPVKEASAFYKGVRNPLTSLRLKSPGFAGEYAAAFLFPLIIDSINEKNIFKKTHLEKQQDTLASLLLITLAIENESAFIESAYYPGQKFKPDLAEFVFMSFYLNLLDNNSGRLNKRVISFLNDLTKEIKEIIDYKKFMAGAAACDEDGQCPLYLNDQFYNLKNTGLEILFARIIEENRDTLYPVIEKILLKHLELNNIDLEMILDPVPVEYR